MADTWWKRIYNRLIYFKKINLPGEFWFCVSFPALLGLLLQPVFPCWVFWGFPFWLAISLMLKIIESTTLFSPYYGVEPNCSSWPNSSFTFLLLTWENPPTTQNKQACIAVLLGVNHKGNCHYHFTKRHPFTSDRARWSQKYFLQGLTAFH